MRKLRVDMDEVRDDLALYYDDIAHMDAEIGELLSWLTRRF